jgi:glutathione S-transferase
MLKLVGAYGSPYSIKMRAVLRYRRIPFEWIVRGSREDTGIPSVPVALIPVLVFPASGDEPESAMIDSTFQIDRLERSSGERRIRPDDPALRWLDLLIEDYADEWLTKAMFHYRWSYPADIHKASHVLPLDMRLDLKPERLAQLAGQFAARQIGRLAVVGSNEQTRATIEASYLRLLILLDTLLLEAPFMLGQRPGAGDFAIYGQLSQLVKFDPTPAEIAAARAPRVCAWVNRMADLGALIPAEDGWSQRDQIRNALKPLFGEIGRVHVPFLLANAQAVNSRAQAVELEIDGTRWTQAPFPYQAKCLGWLRDNYAALQSEDQAWVLATLSGSGCENLLN